MMFVCPFHNAIPEIFEAEMTLEGIDNSPDITIRRTLSNPSGRPVSFMASGKTMEPVENSYWLCNPTNETLTLSCQCFNPILEM